MFSAPELRSIIRGWEASPNRFQISRFFIHSALVSTVPKMNEESVRRLLRQVQAASQNRPKPGPGGFFAGSGLVLLVLGGLAVNASLFNGMRAPASLEYMLIYAYGPSL